jgi:hypothetical protein
MGEPVREDPLDRLRERIRATEEAARKLTEETIRITGAAGPADPPPPPPPPPGDPPPPPPPPPPTQGGGDEPPSGERPPPRGWSVPGAEPPPTLGYELQAIVALLESAKSLIPPELQQQFAQVLRELLLAIRALIDWYLDRIDRRPRERADVQDIPID